MKEKFEHKITNRINEVFDSHQVEFNPQDWEKLKAQLPEEKSRIAVVFWTMAKVAAVILLFLVGIYMFWDNGSFDQKDETMVENNIVQPPEGNSSENAIVDSIGNAASGNLNITENNPDELDKKSTKIVMVNNLEKNPEEKNPESGSQIIADILIENKLQKSRSGISRQVGETNTINSENKIPQQIAVSDISQNNEIIPDTNINIGQERKLPSINVTETNVKKNKFKLGVEMATFTNYSKDNFNPSMSYGGGIAANIPMNTRFSFNPGLVFSAYNMELQNSQNFIPPPNMVNFTTSGGYPSNSNLTPTEMQLTGLDIPVNFQYQFIKRKRGNYFLELGFSSLLYISQNYSYELTYIDYSTVQTGIIYTTTEETSIEDFKTFDFAKFLNFSVGLDYHLSKRFDMVVNPYLKYPVNMLSGDELKFGSGGLKLKFMIVPKK